MALHRDFPCLGGPHLNLKNYLHAILIQLFQTKTPLRTLYATDIHARYLSLSDELMLVDSLRAYWPFNFFF